MLTHFNEPDFKEQFNLALKSEFTSYEVKALEFNTTAAVITVNNTDELNIAKSRILDLSTWMKNLIALHKKTKDPLFNLTKLIDAKKKSLEENLEASKNTIVSKITFFETLEKKRIEKDLLEIQKEKSKLDDLIKQDVARINRMVSNIRAMLYGGDIVNASGTFPKPGCFKIEEIEDVENIISNNIPTPDKFRSECLPTYQDAVRIIADMISARKISVMTSKGTVLSDNETSIISESTQLIANHDKVVAKQDRMLDKQIENTQTGFRRVIEYDVFNVTIVPREFLMLDTSKINQFKIDNREKILEALKDETNPTGHGFINGIRFRVEQTSIIR